MQELLWVQRRRRGQGLQPHTPSGHSQLPTLVPVHDAAPQGLLALLRSMPALQELALPQCSRLEGPAIQSLPQLVPQLR